MKLSACIEWLFADEADSLADRVHCAKKAGLDGVEFHLWRDKPIEDIKAALDETGLTLTSFCVDPRRSIVDLTQQEELLTAIEGSAGAAQTLGCSKMIIASGFVLPGKTPEEHFELAVATLKTAAALAEEKQVTLLLEPLNDKVDHPGMYLVSVSVALDLVEAVNSPNLRLIYDAYHSLVMGDDITTVLKGRMQWVEHIQVADMPGRGAPGTGDIDWQAVMSMLESEGYKGWIGMEFVLNDMTTAQAVASTRKALGME